MNILFVLLGMNVYIIFGFRRAWLLHTKPFLLLLSFNLLLFFLAHLLLHYAIGDQRFIPLLKVPLIYQIMFLVLVTIYRKLFHSDPADTFWSRDITKMKDGIFNFIFAILLAVVIIWVF